MLLQCCVISLAISAPAPAQKPQPRTAAAPPNVSIQVTDREGTPLADVAVIAAGPVDRSGTTGENGALTFRTMRAGTYRLRFERAGFVTLEREIVVRAGAPAEISVALTPASEEEAASAEPEPPPPPSPAPREVDPRVISIPDFLEKNLIGSEPQRRTLIACAEGGTARLLQIRESLENQLHTAVDEVFYVVAGAGIISLRNQDTRIGPGHFALVPRGVPHSIRRDGRTPLIALSILSGSPCTEGGEAVR